MAVGDIVLSVTADVSPLQSGMAKGVSALAAMEKSGKALATQLDKIGEAGVKFQQQVRDFAGVSDGIAKSARSSAQAFQAFDDARASVDRLRASYDPLFAASQRYEAALRELDAALEMGVLTGNQHAQMVDRLGDAYLGAGTQLDRAHGGLLGMGNISDQTRGKIQQIGFQVQDFAVQVGAGTSATQAFAQQFPQLAGAFGPVGIAIGTAAAISIPLLVAAFGDGGKAAQTFAQTVDALSAATRRFNEAAKAYSADGLQDILDKYGEINGEVLQLIENQRNYAMAAAQDAAVQAIRKLAEEFGVASINLDAVGRAAQTSQIAIVNMSRELGLSVDETRALVRAMQEASTADTFEEQAAAIGKVNTILGKSSIAAGELAGAALEAESNLRELAATEPSANWLAPAIEAAKSLYGYLFAANQQNAALAGALRIGASAESGSGSIAPPGVSPGFTAPATINVPAINTGGSGGGGGGQNPLIADLEALQNQLATQAELEQQAFDASQATLQAALDQRMITMAEYQASMERLQAQHQERMSQIDVARYGDGQQQLAGYLGVIADTFQSGNERMQKMGRIFGAAEALVNAWRAYSQTLADPRLPFFAKFAAGAAVLSAGMNAVNAIKSGSSGGAARASAPSAASAPASPLEVRLTGFGPGDLISGGMIGSLLDKLSAEAGDRGYKIMVAA